MGTDEVIWQDKDGRTLCCICFEFTAKADLEPVSDEPGMFWDVCTGCAAREKVHGVSY